MDRNIKTKRIYSNDRIGDFLVLSITKFGMTIVHLTKNQKLYKNINVRLYNNLYVCIDRVTYIPWSDIENTRTVYIDQINQNTYSNILNIIHQFYMGNIVESEIGFLYLDDYENYRKSRKAPRIVLSVTGGNNTDPISNIYNKIPTIRDMENFQISTNDEESWRDDELAVQKYAMDQCEMAVQNCELTPIAEELGIPIMAMFDRENERADILIDLIARRKSDTPPTGHSSKPRYKDYDRTKRWIHRYFTIDEVKIIATSMNSSSVASKYLCSKTIATQMINNAKRLLGYEINSRNIENNFTCYFNEGKSVDDVAKIYPDLSRSIIERNYKYWKINSNIDNNNNVLKRWRKIINDNDYERMADAVYGNTIESFALKEGCTMSCATDIIGKLADILCKNPLACSGFGKVAYDENALGKVLNDANYRNYIEDRTLIQLYNITKNLESIYVKSYDDHADILSGIKPIPDEVPALDRDSFMSLIWNRYNRWVINPKTRKLSDRQINALDHGTPQLVSTLFMINYNKAVGLISRYKNENKK